MSSQDNPRPTLAHRTSPPTFFQSLLASIILVWLSLLLLPITLGLVLVALIWTRLNGTSLATSTANSPPKTVLVTGARSNKALTLIRAFKRAGHKVIAAEEIDSGSLACARFSQAVDKYYLLPLAPHDYEGIRDSAYIDAIKSIVAQEHVDAWVPCSTVHATMYDSETARQINAEKLGGTDAATPCDTFIQHPDIASSLHWKDRFYDLLMQLGFPTPESKRVTNIAQALDFLYSPSRPSRSYILKCLTLDDLARDDLTLLPLATREETLAHLKAMPTPMNHATPFLLQRFLTGPEYCCHVAARDGELVAFVACRSNEMLMRYVDVNSINAKEMKMGSMIEQWVREFLRRWKMELDARGGSEYQRKLTGHFSFDFIWEEDEQILYALECNVVCQSQLSHILHVHSIDYYVAGAYRHMLVLYLNTRYSRILPHH